MKEKFKQAIDCLINKDSIKAKKYIKEAIQKNQTYLDYKKRLSEMGLDLQKVDIPDKIYDDIENVIKDYDRPLQLKILDRTYRIIATNKQI